MLIRAYDDQYPAQLCTLSGDHIRLAPRELLHLALSPMALGFALAVAGVLAIFIPGVYHETPGLSARAIFWSGQILGTYALFVGLFALFDHIGRKLQRGYIMITVGFQAFILFLTLPWAFVITSDSANLWAYLSEIETGYFLGHLMIALLGELVLVLVIIPEQARHLGTQIELTTGKRQPHPIERRGNCILRAMTWALRGTKAAFASVQARRSNTRK